MYFVPRLSYGSLEQGDTAEVIIRRSAADKRARGELGRVLAEKYVSKPKKTHLRRPFKAKWQKLTAQQFAAIATDVAIELARKQDKAPWPMLHTNFTAYAVRLSCYSKTLFIDVVMEKTISPGQFGQASILVSDARVMSISTEMSNITTWSFVHGPRLRTLEQASDYLRLVGWVICTDTGPFQIVEDKSFARLSSGTIPLKTKITKIKGRSNNGPDSAMIDWALDATILKAGKLHRVEFKIKMGRTVRMDEDFVRMTEDEMIEDLSDVFPKWIIEPYVRYQVERKT